MSNLQCRLCGTELLPDAAFCRQCGALASDLVLDSEQRPTLFSETESSTTQRLDPRLTSLDRGDLHVPARPLDNGSSESRPARRHSLTSLAIIAFIAGILTVVAMVILTK